MSLSVWKVENCFPFVSFWVQHECTGFVVQAGKLLTEAEKNEDSIRESQVFNCYFYSYFLSKQIFIC